MMRAKERGAILLLAVLLGGLLAALTLSMLSAASMEMRGSANAEATSAARRLARAGVEIAAARRQEGPLVAGNELLSLGADQELELDIDPERSPNVRVVGRSGSARSAIEAELSLGSALDEHALVVFGARSSFPSPVQIRGAAYFAAREEPFVGEPVLDLCGDLELAAAGFALPFVRFAHVGRLRSSRRAAELPQLDLAALLRELERRAVPLERLRGGGTWKDLRHAGVLWVELARGEELILENLELEGTLLVQSVDLAPEQQAIETAHARVVMRGRSRVRARAEVLGSLALAAPCTEWSLAGEGTTELEGLALVGEARELHDLELRGALWARGAVQALHRVTFEPSLGEPLERPAALLAPPSLSRVRIEWR